MASFWDNILNYIVPQTSQPPTTATPPPPTANQGLVQQWYQASQTAKQSAASAPTQTAVTAPSTTLAVPVQHEAGTQITGERVRTAAEKTASDIKSFLGGGARSIQSELSAIFAPIVATPQAQAVIRAVTPVQAQTTSDLSQFSRNIYTGSERVASVIETGMGIADIGARRIERQLPGPLGDVYGGIYSIGRGLVFTGEAGLVRTAGMIPGGVETIAKHPSLIPAFAAAGVITQVSGMKEGFTERPLQTIGEFVVMTAIGEGVPAGLKTMREAVPYDIALGKPTGVIVEVGKMYSPKVEAVPDLPGLVPRTTEIASEGMQAFATRPTEGISNVFMRLPQAAVSRLQAEAIVSAPKFMSTPYGSYMKVSIEGMKETLPGAAETVTKAAKPTRQIGFTDMPTDVELKALSNIEFAHRMGEAPALQDIQTASYSVFRRMGIEPLSIRNAERFLNEFDKYYKTDLSKAPAESRPVSIEGLPYILGDILKKVPYKPETYFKYEAAIPTIETPTLMQRLTPTIQKGVSAIKAAPEDILTSLQERIRIERRLDIYPAEFKLGEPQSPRAQIPKYTGVYDIWPESPMAGKPGMHYDVWGGIIEGSVAKTEIAGSAGFKQLTSPKMQTLEELFGRSAPSPKVPETGSGISFTQPDIPFDMPASTGGFGEFGIEAAAKRTTVKTTSRPTFMEQPFELSPQLELKSVPKRMQFAEPESPIMKGFEDMTPKLQLEKVITTKRQMKTMEREPILESLKGLEFPKLKFETAPPSMETSFETSMKTNIPTFKEEPVPAKTPLYFDQKTTSFDTGFDTYVPPESTPSETIPDYTTDIFTPTVTKPDTTHKRSPIYAPSPLPETFPDPSAFPFPKVFPQPREQAKPKPEPGREWGGGFFNFKIPEIPIKKLLLTKFDEVRTAKKKKKTIRKITSYLIKNPLTDLEDVIGTMDTAIKTTLNPSKKRNKRK